MRKALSLQLIIMSGIWYAKVIFGNYDFLLSLLIITILQISCVVFFWELFSDKEVE